MTGTSPVRIDHAVVHGTFTLDGETFDVDNNVWAVGNDSECVVIDVPHSVEEILDLVAGRTVKAILLTHAHDDHCREAVELRRKVEAPVCLHPEDKPLWTLTRPGEEWDVDLVDRSEIAVGSVAAQVLHTPGHAPGACSFYFSGPGCVFTGDTPFEGGPGATGRSFSDRSLLEESIAERLLVLPAETVVRTGHGANTTIGQESARAEF